MWLSHFAAAGRDILVCVSMRIDTGARRRLQIAGLSLLIVCGPAHAAAPVMSDEFRQLFQRGAASGAYAGIAVGLIEGGEQQTWFFGDAKKAALPDADTAFEIGAVSDVLAAILLARAAVEGKVRLGASMREQLGTDISWADGDLAATPVVALATQQTTLPATPANLFPASVDDPYADYRNGDLLAFLANWRAPSGARRNGYSALNAALLARVLARAYAGDYAAVLADKVLVPLGMTHTVFDDPADFPTGHAFGAPVAHWHFAALAAAAGLRSTLADLLALVRVNLRPDASPLRAALLLARQSRATDENGGLGLGWNIHDVAMDEQTWPLVWRASETGGFSTFIGFRSDKQQGLVILANSAVALAPIGLAWLSGQPAPGAPAPPYVAELAKVERYPGLYRLLDGADVVVRAQGTALSAQLRGQPPWPLYALAEDVYASSDGAIGVTFVRNIDEIGGLLLRTDRGFVSANRLSARAPRLSRNPISVDAAALARYAGDYVVAADVMLRVAASSEGLSVQYTGSAAIPMRAYAPDRFSDADGGNGIIFRRDEQGRIDSATIELAGGEREATPAHWRVP